MASSNHPDLTVEEVIEDYKEIQLKLNKQNINRTEYLEHGKYPRYYLDKLFGGWNGLKQAVGDKVLMHKEVTKEMVAETALNLYQKHGKLTAQIMRKEGLSQIVVDKHYGNFTNLMKSLNLEQSAIGKTRSFKEEEFYKELLFIQSKFGYVNAQLLAEHSQIPLASFINRFKTFGEACLQAGVRHIGQDTINAPDGEATKTIEAASKILEEPFYHTELTFDWLRNDNTGVPLPVDAYFPNHNLILEYHGPRHYEQNTFHNNVGQYSLEEIQRRDLLKVKLTFENGFNIIEVPHFEKHNVEIIIQDFLNATKK